MLLKSPCMDMPHNNLPMVRVAIIELRTFGTPQDFERYFARRPRVGILTTASGTSAGSEVTRGRGNGGLHAWRYDFYGGDEKVAQITRNVLDQLG